MYRVPRIKPILLPCNVCGKNYAVAYISKCVKCGKNTCKKCSTRSMRYGAICRNCFSSIMPAQQELMNHDQAKMKILIYVGIVLIVLAIVGVVPAGNAPEWGLQYSDPLVVLGIVWAMVALLAGACCLGKGWTRTVSNHPLPLPLE